MQLGGPLTPNNAIRTRVQYKCRLHRVNIGIDTICYIYTYNYICYIYSKPNLT